MPCMSWPCGAMDNASAYGAEDSRFESWQDRIFFFNLPSYEIAHFDVIVHCQVGNSMRVFWSEETVFFHRRFKITVFRVGV